MTNEKLAAAPEPQDCAADDAMVEAGCAAWDESVQAQFLRGNLPFSRPEAMRAALTAALSTRQAGLAVPNLPGNWPEDASHENGDYECACMTCKQTFYGHKRRVICKVCATPVEAGLTDAERVLLEVLEPHTRPSSFANAKRCDISITASEADTIVAALRRLAPQAKENQS